MHLGYQELKQLRFREALLTIWQVIAKDNALIDKELIVSRGYTSTNIFPYKYKGWSIPSWIIKEEDISKEPIQLEFDL